MNGRIYLDHNATAPPAAGVADGIARAWDAGWGNPSSAHAEGRRARDLRERARAAVAEAVGTRPEDLVFTSGGSEADALAIRGLVECGAVETLVVGALEHPAVMETVLWLAGRGAAELRVAEADARGVVTAGAVERALAGARRPLVSVMLAQNEIGTLHEVATIAALCRARGVPVHCDAVQALGKVAVSAAELGVDLLSVSSHKIGGPPGVGALAIRRGLEPVPFCVGGGQERGRRPGTEPLPLLIGFGIAAETVPERVGAAPSIAARRDRLEAAVVARFGDGVRVAGAGAPRLPNTAALVFRERSGAAIAAAADGFGLSVSAGSACHAADEGPSPVMRALGFGPEWRSGLVRVSLGPETTGEEVEAALDLLCRAVESAGAP